MCQSISACLKLNRTRLVIVYSYNTISTNILSWLLLLLLLLFYYYYYYCDCRYTSTRSKHKIMDDMTEAIRRGLNIDSRTLKVKFIDDEIGKSYI